MWLFRISPARKKHLAGLVRAGAYLGCVSIVLGAFSLRSARAEMRSKTLELGRQMQKLANATDHDVNKLTLNGQPIWIGSSVAKDAVSVVLDRYESNCQQNTAQPSDSWRQLADKADASTDKSFLSTGILRGGDKEEGTIVCFTKNESSKPSVSEAVKSFTETGNLGAFGSLRYVYAKADDSGKTVVLTAWTDDGFNITSLIPEEGKDSGGADFPLLPRPPSTTRVLATQVEGTPFGVNVYEGHDAPSKVIAYYDDEMRKRGWFALDPEVDRQLDNPRDGGVRPMARLYEKDGVVFTLGANVRDGATMVAVGLAGVSASDRPARGASSSNP